MEDKRGEHMPKIKLTVTIDEELYTWLEKQVELKKFGNKSHGVEVALLKLKEAESE